MLEALHRYEEDEARLILECATNSPSLPLKIGKLYTAVVRAVRTSGDSPLTHGTMVLSIGPSLAATVPTVRPGATVHIFHSVAGGLCQD